MGPAISGDGGLVVFTSLATNLGVGESAAADVFGRDVVRGTTELLSRRGGTIDAGGDTDSVTPGAVSTNGRFVAFVSSAANLDPDDTDSILDVYLHDRKLNTTTW